MDPQKLLVEALDQLNLLHDTFVPPLHVETVELATVQKALSQAEELVIQLTDLRESLFQGGSPPKNPHYVSDQEGSENA